MKFRDSEARFLQRNELCRLATIDSSGAPHLVPVCYVFRDGYLYIVSDLETMKIRNIKRDRRVTVLVDTYKPNRAVLIRGEAEILLSGEEFKEISELFFKRFAWARRDRWDEGEVALIKVKPLKSVSWGLR
ncbi:MAG: pyridoxamine 5'-phosphate oxidase family protein [Nitrososphaerota archaeon]|nr:pyridoxamine 5'-phosphate oxidase family protein [Candidatus Calditenuaceae archaeon]MDW8073071.1 pyridoxamine 5'-phosphate oxidase family protein [Nitrososphaerota archaeon]